MSLEQYEQYKEDVKRAAEDLNSVADALNLTLGKGQKQGKNRLYHSPHHKDTNPSLSIFYKNGSWGWKDHSTGQTGGDAISLYQYVTHDDFKGSVEKLGELFGVQKPNYGKSGSQPKKSLVDFIADRVTVKSDENVLKIKGYLTGRKISEEAINHAIKSKTLGWNDWTSDKTPAGQVGYGSDGVSFIVRNHLDNGVVGIDTRYIEPHLNGGVKTNSQGDKDGYPWVADWNQFKRAHTICVVESAINALSVDTCEIPYWASLALRGTQNAENIPTAIFENKFVVIAMDYDKPFDQSHNLAGHRPGPEAGWKLYDRLTQANIPALMVDQSEWTVGDDVNDVLKTEGVKILKHRLQRLEECAIPGFLHEPHGGSRYPGVQRTFLPTHDFYKYWRYLVEKDFTRYIGEFKKDGDTGETDIKYEDLASFRIAGMERINIQDWMATVKGGKPAQPEIIFSVAAQTPQHGRKLKRLVMNDEQFASVQHWAKFGYISKPSEFMRLTSIMTRTIDESDRLAMNFVGLAYKQGKPQLNEGEHCFFRFPEEQCPYSGLKFHTGSENDARKVVNAFQNTFKNNAALIPLVWGLGAHLKLFLGFWPHLQMEAEKGAGKSTLLDKLGAAIQMQVYSKEMLKSDYRLLCSVSYTCHPVAWEEISTTSQQTIAAANSTLQEAFNYRYSTRGNQGKSFLACSPVLLGGEEVDMDSLLGKMVRTSVTFKKQNIPVPEDTPTFPMRQWLEWLAQLRKEQVIDRLDLAVQDTLTKSMISDDDANARRIVKNFATVRLAWRYLCEFAGIDRSQGDFERDLIAEMNNYLSDTESDRQPWVWIMEIVLSEIDAGRYPFPYGFAKIVGDDDQEHRCILLRHTQMMNHIRHSNHLRERWNALPIRKAKTFKGQMTSSGVIIKDKGVEHRENGQRISNMLAISIDKLNGFGLSLSREFSKS